MSSRVAVGPEFADIDDVVPANVVVKVELDRVHSHLADHAVGAQKSVVLGVYVTSLEFWIFHVDVITRVE